MERVTESSDEEFMGLCQAECEESWPVFPREEKSKSNILACKNAINLCIHVCNAMKTCVQELGNKALWMCTVQCDHICT